MSRQLGLLVLVGFAVYLAYRFWAIGYRLGGPLLAAGVCGGLLLFGGLGLWWATRQPPQDRH
jgi:hypothetical protein